MTKKRFVKLLMSYGVQRNRAQQIARDVISRNIPYKEALPAAIAAYRMRRDMQELGRWFGELAEQIKSTIIPAFNQLKEAFKYTPRESLPCPDYGQAPKTITKPYIKQITKSRSRERKK